MHNFRKLAIWTKSISLVTKIYELTNTFPSLERFGLMSQMQRAAVSVPTNIAEGSAKTSNKNFCPFFGNISWVFTRIRNRIDNRFKFKIH